MKRFKNILLLYNCDRATLDRAAALAKHNRARLTVVQVVKYIPKQSQHVQLGNRLIDLQRLAIEEYESKLKDFVAPLKQAGLRASVKVLVGTPFLEIIRDVIANKRDLVMMSAEGKGGLKERLFGSLSLQLMRKCPCPMWVMKPTRRRRFRRILAAVDPDPTDKVRDSLNAMILQLASSLASADGAELHVAHAWTLLGERLMRDRGGFSDLEIREHADEEERRHQILLDALLTKHTSNATRVHLIKGDADSVIPQIARTENVDLLVMGTVCRTGIPAFFIGNTAEIILDKVDCSVLTVKPDGFQSPVKLS